ncbi:MAG: NADH-quinone oxidoreductase subunit N [Chloroherpetonaceae bacterium]|nr:NADH-quinone oxidoreductase subunit N [Chloroherpetonaceae bacterium]MDW8437247.1 NADH-quinone oxidoreductase subunit N [Chloroherpetonaceae bacterium]
MPNNLPDIVAQIKASVGAFIPELSLSALFLLLIVLDMVLSEKRVVIPVASLVGFVITGFFVWQQIDAPNQEYFLRMHVVDPFAVFFKFLFLGASALAVLLSMDSEELNEKNARSIGEYYAILVAMALGMFLMASASDMLMMFLALELVSISSYVLTGYLKGQIKSSEASLKYIVYGAASSGLMAYGMSIIYGLTGQTNIYEIARFIEANEVDEVALTLASLLVMGGFGYKIGAVPFHFWSPDVYEGAPTPVTAFLSVGSKAAGFAMLMRFFKIAIPAEPTGEFAFDWVNFFALIALASMLLGNFAAIWQSSVKRMLAYSSIAHAGYLLLGVLVADDLGAQAVMFYLVAYTVMNVGAFFVVVLIANKIGSDDVNDYRGLGKKMPLAAAALTVFLVSLTGLPPTVGFVGKYMIFTALLGKGPTFLTLAIIGVLTSAVSLYYYFKIPLNMYLREAEEESDTPVQFGAFANGLVAFLMVATIAFGLYFAPLANFAKNSVTMLVMN